MKDIEEGKATHAGNEKPAGVDSGIHQRVGGGPWLASDRKPTLAVVDVSGAKDQG
ncbi:hypothetical protein [Methylotetracoccus oryzae]|uniref:hypothetical protein n=1 Tax=Methylotetracoccus oryzae TaxID=1919059 RepID=UPI0013A54BD3|nr:hypothetical protein [Methylotetracoccus oryzae]